MSLHAPVSLAGLNADLDALRATHEALFKQQNVLQSIIREHNSNNCIPGYLIDEARESAFTKSIDKDVLETLLLVGIISSFQKFVKVLVRDVFTTLMNKHKRFSDLEESMRGAYLIAAAAIYRHKKYGTVHGVRINFSIIENSMRDCLNDNENYTLEGDAITAEMGNPNENTIESIFERMGIENPFDNQFGAALTAAGWSEGTTDGENLRKANAKLNKNMERRNDAVHGMQKIVFNPGELEDLLSFFQIFGKCLFDRADASV